VPGFCRLTVLCVVLFGQCNMRSLQVNLEKYQTTANPFALINPAPGMKVLLNFCLQHIHNLIINLSQQKYDVMMWSDVSSCSVQWCFGSFGFCISDKQGNMLHFKNCILIYLDFADIIAIMVCIFSPQHLAKNCSWLMDAEIWINFFSVCSLWRSL